MPSVAVPELDYSLFYRVYGGPSQANFRPRLLFLTGLGGRHTDFKRYAEHFAKTCHVCLMDNRGCGFSGMPSRTWRWTTTQMAKDTLYVLNDLGWHGDVHVVGHSLGGMVAQELAVLTPNRVSSLTLVSTFASVLSVMPTFRQVASFFLSFVKTKTSGFEDLFPDQWLQAQRYPNVGAAVTNERWLMMMVFLSHRDVPHEFQFEYDTVPSPSYKVRTRQLTAVLTHHMSKQRFDTIKINNRLPVLVLTGSEDVLVHPLNSHVLSELTEGELVTVEGAGHGVMVQCEEEVKEYIAKHILPGEPIDV